MGKYIDKDTLVAEMMKDPYGQYVQYDSIKAGIQANAETYSFNIESNLFNQLAKEQQGLWRKEIEQAYINGGEAGVELARDLRYKENLETKEVATENHINCKVGWYDGVFLDCTQEQLSTLLDKIGVNVGDEVKIYITK